MPWNCPEDLRHFKSYTWGHTLLMGGNTFESLKSKLPGRPNIVISNHERLTKDGSKPDLTIRRAPLEEICKYVKGEVCVIGGISLLMEAAHLVDHASVTVMLNRYCSATHIMDRRALFDILKTRLEVSAEMIALEALAHTFS